MGESEQEKRARYLKENFPEPSLGEMHAFGPFAEQALEFLAHPLQVELSRTGRRYIVIDAVELGDNPYHEELRFRFRLVKEPREVETPRWGDMSEPLVGSTEPVYYFSLTSDSSLEAGIKDLRTFIAEHLEDELTHTLSKTEELGFTRTVSPLFIRGLITDVLFYVGGIGLLALAVYEAFRHLYELAIILGAGALIILGLREALRPRIQTQVNAQQSRYELTTNGDFASPKHRLPSASVPEKSHHQRWVN